MMVTGDTSHATRIYEMHQCLSDGQLPCRWAPHIGNGYGYPLFNYYPPLPYYAGAALHWFGFSYLRSVDLLAIVALVSAGLSMFALTRRLWGELGGLVSAVAYMYAPFLALDIYMRGAIGELWALAVLPALFLAVHELIDSGRARFVPLAALLGALLLLSHNLVAVIFAPALALWVAVFLVRRGRDAARPLLLLAVALLWAIGLAAFFTLPVLVEGDLVQLDTLARFPFRYSDHFASATDLFFLRTSDYSALLGGRDSTPVQIGWFHWGIALLAIPTAVALYQCGRRTLATVIALLLLFFAIGVVMSISVSRPIWDQFDSLRFLQFPWRYLGLATFATAALAGATFALGWGRPAWRVALAVALVALFVVSGRPFFHAEYRFDISDAEMFSPPLLETYQATTINAFPPAASGVELIEQLPRDAKRVPPLARTPASVVSGSARIVSSQAGSDWLNLDIDAGSPSRIQASIFEFPNWRVRVDGERVSHTASKPYGLIEFTVPAGRHHVELHLEDTNVRRLGNVLSLVSWAALALGLPAFVLGRPWLRR